MMTACFFASGVGTWDTSLTDSVVGFIVLGIVTCVASAINSVAGGGTILTFPILVANLPASAVQMVTANATSTIGLWPGAVAAAWAYRGDREKQVPWARWLVVPSILGAIVGSLLVLVLPMQWFNTMVPWLILVAAVLFAIQPYLSRLTAANPTAGQPAPAESVGPAKMAGVCVLQFLVSVYGGYFGAGIGILMLAMLGGLGLGNIHKLNAVKNVLGMLVNGVAAAAFALSSLAVPWGAIGPYSLPSCVSWPHAAVMAVSSILGGLVGSYLARLLPATVVRQCVALIGFVLAGYYFLA